MPDTASSAYLVRIIWDRFFAQQTTLVKMPPKKASDA